MPARSHSELLNSLRLRPCEPARILGFRVSFLRARSHSGRVEYPMCRSCLSVRFLSAEVAFARARAGSIMRALTVRQSFRFEMDSAKASPQRVRGFFFQSGQGSYFCHGRKQVLPWVPRLSPDMCNTVSMVLNTWPNREVDQMCSSRRPFLFMATSDNSCEDGQ